jgi:hypothetical protein
MRNLYQTSVLILLFMNQAFAQNDTVDCHEKFNKPSPWVFVVPSALVSYGIIAQFSPALHDFDRKIDHKISQNIHGRCLFDDYIQYLPYTGIYTLDLCGVKAKHNVIDRTLVLATSITICATVVQIPKHTTRIARPDGSNTHSFPSGHTATAFLGAHILFREYKEASPWIGIAGYGVATTTGAMRIINRKHWLSDVFAGAGTGIISAELSYLMLPVWHRLFSSNGNAGYLTINPLLLPNGFGFGISCVF